MGTQSKIKPWSISTTVRNPARLAEFLRILKEQFEGQYWDDGAQVDYQAYLIASWLYGAFSNQFYIGLSDEQIAMLEGDGDISFEQAKAIMDAKRYKDPGMRGRTSFKPLQKLGFAALEGKKIHITKAGLALLDEEADVSDLFLRSLLKWQLPNILDRRGFPASGRYSLKPFISVLHLIAEVNRLCRGKGVELVGISQVELAVFGLTMIRWDELESSAQEIVRHRNLQSIH